MNGGNISQMNLQKKYKIFNHKKTVNQKFIFTMILSTYPLFTWEELKKKVVNYLENPASNMLSVPFKMKLCSKQPM